MLSDMGTRIPMGEELNCSTQRTGRIGVGGPWAKASRSCRRHPELGIIASLDVPERAEGQLWAFEECYVDDVPDPSVIGLVRAKDMDGWLQTEDTLWAVRFDVRSNQLMQLDPAHVKCV